MGEGPQDAALMIVGEQPGDQEDLSGRPFVGPAGQLLDVHLEKVGIDRRAAYVTNAVKHFKYVQRGKRRLHQNPGAKEIDTCRWWIESERAIVQPKLVLAMGASAARGMLGRRSAYRACAGRPSRWRMAANCGSLRTRPICCGSTARRARNRRGCSMRILPR